MTVTGSMLSDLRRAVESTTATRSPWRLPRVTGGAGAGGR